jgi:hypothetical protein
MNITMNEKTLIAKNLELALSKGWEIKDYNFDLDSTLKVLQKPNILWFYLSNYLSQLAGNLNRFPHLPFPANILLSMEDGDSKEAEFALFSQFCKNYVDPWETNDDCPTFRALISDVNERRRRPMNNGESFLTMEAPDNPSDKYNYRIIHQIVPYLGEPNLMDLEFINQTLYIEYPARNKKEKLISILKEGNVGFGSSDGGRLNISWEDGSTLKVVTNSRGELKSLELKVASEKIVQKALSGQVLLSVANNEALGKMTETFPLHSFHLEKKNFEEELDEYLKESPQKFCTLIQGPPGAGKTEWVKSYIKEKLSEQGFFTYFLDVNNLKSFSPDPSIPKVCLFVNEVDNLILDRSDKSHDSGEQEALLGFFDGTIYQSVKDHNKGSSNQQILIFLTANQTNRLDPAFLRPGRVDLIRTFEKQYVSNVDDSKLI